MFINLGLTFPNGSILQLCCSSKQNICFSKEKPKTLGNRSLDRKFMMAHLKLPKNNPGAAQNRRFKTANLDQEKILALHSTLSPWLKSLFSYQVCQNNCYSLISQLSAALTFDGQKACHESNVSNGSRFDAGLAILSKFQQKHYFKKTEALPANVYMFTPLWTPRWFILVSKAIYTWWFSKGFCIFTGRYPRTKHPYFVQGCTHIQPIRKNDDGPWGIELRWDAPNPAKLYNSFMAGMIPQVVIFQHFFSISQVRRWMANPKVFPSLQEVILSWLVVLTILKNMKVNGKDYPIYYGK